MVKHAMIPTAGSMGDHDTHGGDRNHAQPGVTIGPSGPNWYNHQQEGIWRYLPARKGEFTNRWYAAPHIRTDHHPG